MKIWLAGQRDDDENEKGEGSSKGKGRGELVPAADGASTKHSSEAEVIRWEDIFTRTARLDSISQGEIITIAKSSSPTSWEKYWKRLHNRVVSTNKNGGLDPLPYPRFMRMNLPYIQLPLPDQALFPYPHPHSNSYNDTSLQQTAEYLCLLPSKEMITPRTTLSSEKAVDKKSETKEIDALAVFSALDHLDGKGCIYHRQGWFTYS